jgi:hypothetical protein
VEPIPPSDGWHDDAGGMIETSAEWLMNEGLIIIYRVLSHQKRGDIYIYRCTTVFLIFNDSWLIYWRSSSSIMIIMGSPMNQAE